jgi:hypothetical protein
LLAPEVTVRSAPKLRAPSLPAPGLSLSGLVPPHLVQLLRGSSYLFVGHKPGVVLHDRVDAVQFASKPSFLWAQCHHCSGGCLAAPRRTIGNLHPHREKARFCAVVQTKRNLALFSPGLLHLSELSPVSAISLALPIRKGTVGPVVEQHTCSIGRVFADFCQLAPIHLHSQTRTLIGPQLAILEIKDLR